MSFSPAAIEEFRSTWLPNLSDPAVDRLIDLLSGRPSMLVQSRWTEGSAIGCLATHAGWNDVETERLGVSAGPAWLQKAGLHGSQVVAEWDAAGGDAYRSWQLRGELLQMLREERDRRGNVPRSSECAARCRGAALSRV